VNPVQGNHLALFWNCSPVQAVEKASKLFGPKVLIEGGITMINELIDHKVIDRLELSVTEASGGEEKIDWRALLARFANCESRKVEGTTFYTATN